MRCYSSICFDYSISLIEYHRLLIATNPRLSRLAFRLCTASHLALNRPPPVHNPPKCRLVSSLFQSHQPTTTNNNNLNRHPTSPQPHAQPEPAQCSVQSPRYWHSCPSPLSAEPNQPSPAHQKANSPIPKTVSTTSTACLTATPSKPLSRRVIWAWSGTTTRRNATLRTRAPAIYS
jgi:hypothetical protein